MTEEKKNLFDKAVDALTNRDEEGAESKAVAERVAAHKAAATKHMNENAASNRVAAEKAAGAKAAINRRAATQMDAMKAASEKAAAPRKGVVTIKSLRIRADHNTASEVVAGLVNGDDVMVLSTWSDGKNTWARLDKGWAAMVYDGETCIKLS